MESLPGFDLREHGRLLEALQAVGYGLQPVEAMAQAVREPPVFLRPAAQRPTARCMPQARVAYAEKPVSTDCWWAHRP